MTIAIAVLGFLLALKHFFADGLWQTEWHYKNKGTFLHPGGIAHSFNHGLGALAALLVWKYAVHPELSLSLIGALFVFDFLTHYIIDYCKMNLTKGKGYSAMGEDKDGKPCQMIYDNKFYVWLVADQCAHFTIYGIMIAIAAGTL
ncbi:MAG: DUF3307 domain-containing protein [Pseudomonadota bacterium]|nr:DUF3307 domain-containing protein [Pseudomonadota bacterium]